jgi:hypothetical protein
MLFSAFTKNFVTKKAVEMEARIIKAIRILLQTGTSPQY